MGDSSELYTDELRSVVDDSNQSSSLSFSNDIPYVRYLSSIGLLSNVESTHNNDNIHGRGNQMLAFGGDGGQLHNTYPDSYGYMPNSFFDDVWLLSPRGIEVSNSMKQRERELYCDWRWLSDSTAMQSWNSACGWDTTNVVASPGECSLESILIAAWCREQYQSFYMT